MNPCRPRSCAHWATPARRPVTSARAIETFRSTPEVQTQWAQVRIPYQGVHLDGYYLDVTGDVPGPTLLAHGGYDSTVEEMFFATFHQCMSDWLDETLRS